MVSLPYPLGVRRQLCKFPKSQWGGPKALAENGLGTFLFLVQAFN